MRKKKLFFALGMIVCAAIFGVSAFLLYQKMADVRQSRQHFAEIAEQVKTEPDDKIQTLSAAEVYADVYAQNHDLVGWINIEGTNIDYPVMQTREDPQYYLRRNFEKQSDRYGVPFLQTDCTPLQSDNCILYGHNMKDGAMFADLCRYEDADFCRTHSIIRFDTLEDFGIYQIIAVFKTTVEEQESFPYTQFVEAENAKEFDNYVMQCKERSLYDITLTAKYGEKLLTLSTCEYSRDNGRMVVVAKWIGNQANEE